MEETFLTKSSQATQKLGEDFARKLKNGEVILLYGNLGAGKTTFVQGLAKGLRIQKRIISPTFVIVRTYEISNVKYQMSNIKLFCHVDLYRLQSEKEIVGLGLLELIEDPENIIVIEWPERLGSLLPENAWELYFETIRENERKITLRQAQG